MCCPLVAGVALAWLDLKWRFVIGLPTNASRCHATLPVARSSEYTLNVCVGSVSIGLTSPVRPVRNVLSSSLAAEARMTRLPQTIGLEVPRPGIAVFHLMFLPVTTSQSETAPCPSATPEALMPRNEGQ